MTGTLDLFAMDAPAPAPLAPLPAPSVTSARVTTFGWIKSYVGPPLPAGDVAELPTLNCIEDGHRYRHCRFELSPGVAVGDYPGGFGLRGLRVKGEKELLSLYDAVRRELAREARP